MINFVSNKTWKKNWKYTLLRTTNKMLCISDLLMCLISWSICIVFLGTTSLGHCGLHKQQKHYLICSDHDGYGLFLYNKVTWKALLKCQLKRNQLLMLLKMRFPGNREENSFSSYVCCLCIVVKATDSYSQSFLIYLWPVQHVNL